MDKLSTKEKILAQALLLFNEQGTKSVSTNHIAKETGISPGNLYYHFKNKEEIIFQLWQKMDQNFDCCPAVAQRPLRELSQLEEYFQQINELQWQFRFLIREFPSLIERDAALATAFKAKQERRIAEIAGDVAGAVEGGLLKPMPLPQQLMLAELLWLTSLFWVSYSAGRGQVVTRETIQQGTNALRFLLLPYLAVPLPG